MRRDGRRLGRLYQKLDQRYCHLGLRRAARPHRQQVTAPAVRSAKQGRAAVNYLPGGGFKNMYASPHRQQRAEAWSV